MNITGDASLRGKARALAEQHGIMAQEVMQMFFFERFLVRVAQSRFKENLILKGGLLVASLIGVANRTTMDMDATLKALPLDEQTLKGMVEEISNIDGEDGINFELTGISPIREGSDYGGLRVHLRAVYGRMNTPMKIDITAGDAITPAALSYPFPMMFGGSDVHVLAYPIETIIAEKFEAIIKRGVTTTRARDFYDIVVLSNEFRRQIDMKKLSEAIGRTARRRNSLELMKDYVLVCDELSDSDAIRRLWEGYVADNPYAAGIEVEAAIGAVKNIGDATFSF